MFFTKKEIRRAANVRKLKGTFKQDYRFKIQQIRSMLSKETAYYRELHSAHSTVENSIMTVRNKIVKGYMAAWNNMLHNKNLKILIFFRQTSTLQRHCTEYLKHIFPEMKVRGNETAQNTYSERYSYNSLAQNQSYIVQFI
jgi:hypothetical protein